MGWACPPEGRELTPAHCGFLPGPVARPGSLSAGSGAIPGSLSERLGAWKRLVPTCGRLSATRGVGWGFRVGCSVKSWGQELWRQRQGRGVCGKWGGDDYNRGAGGGGEEWGQEGPGVGHCVCSLWAAG